MGSDNRRLGVLRVSYELLTHLLRLPKDHTVVAVASEKGGVPLEDLAHATASIVIEGPQMPEHFEGNSLPWITLIVDTQGRAEFVP